MPTLFLHFFLFLITTSLTNLIPTVYSNCIEAQKQSLLHFKESLLFDSSSSSKLITWNSSTDCCSWLGVTCSPNGRVVGLDLSRESISCSIDNSSSLFQLQDIQSLNLAYNDFNGSSIPSAIGKLADLRYLNLSSAYFFGDLPNSIGNLKMLSSIHLSDCNFTGSLPKSIENLTQLVELDMSGNGLNSPITSIHWGNLVNLQSLDLSNNQLSGTIPSSLVSLSKLESLTLSDNRFSGQVPEFSNSSSNLLDTLDLENNNLQGAIPASVFNLQGLQTLLLSSNNFSGFPFNGLNHQPKNLSFVDLSHNSLLLINHSSNSSFLQIHDLVLASNKLRAFPGFLRDQITLRSLNLSGNQIQGKIPNWIFSLKSLEDLDLSCNYFVTVEPPLPNSTSGLNFLYLNSNKLQDIPSSYSFPLLSDLQLASNKLTTFPDFLRNHRVHNLDLSNNHIQGQVPNWIWNPNYPQVINLSCNSLSDLQAPLRNSTYVLKSLDLHSNNLQGQIPMFLSARYVDYSRNNFTSGITNDILISPASFLSLSSNNLLGAIPKSICKASLMVLDLSNNSLSGNIPQCLAQVSLSVLSLSGNKITGSIPDNFQEDCRLVTLDLSRNQLHGQFPKSLVNCSSLKVLNVRNNYIGNAFPCVLMRLSTLRVLVLRSNKFYGSIGCSNTNGTNLLQVLDLADNSFSGDIDGRMFLNWHAMMSNEDDSSTNIEYFHQSTGSYNSSGLKADIYNTLNRYEAVFDTPDVYYRDAITAIIKGLEFHLVKISNIFTLVDFSYNRFNGSIPEEIGELKALYVLNLSNNAFTGGIPSSFGQMQQLESLDLSNNQLSGTIPQQMVNLNFLAVLDLSDNQLVGRIPTGTQFSTFPSTSFEGNKGLWGPPLTNDTPPPTPNGSLSPPNSGNEIDWDIISAEIGFTCGFGLAVGSLLFCKRWRKWYYTSMRSILFKIFPQLEHRFGIHRRHVYVNIRR